MQNISKKAHNFLKMHKILLNISKNLPQISTNVPKNVQKFFLLSRKCPLWYFQISCHFQNGTQILGRKCCSAPPQREGWLRPQMQILKCHTSSKIMGLLMILQILIPNDKLSLKKQHGNTHDPVQFHFSFQPISNKSVPAL